MIYTSRKTRRQFLMISGKFGLALPFLPSLAPKWAMAAGDVLPKFVSVVMKNGQRPELWAPSSLLTNLGTLTEPNVRVTNLATYQGREFNKILRSGWDPYFSQMTYLRGLDCVVEKGHNDGECALGDLSFSAPCETIDQVIAQSANFYRGQIPSMKSISLFHSVSRVNSGGKIVRVPEYNDPISLFNRIYFNNESGERASNKKVADFVMERYRMLLNNRNLAGEDKRRLNNYLDQLNETENRISNQRTLTCSKPAPPTFDKDSLYSRFIAFNDLIVLSLSCGATQVATLSLRDAIPTPSQSGKPGYLDNPTNASLDTRGVWHEQGHLHDYLTLTTANAKEKSDIEAILAYNRWYFNNIILDLVKKMDAVIEGNGKSMLNNSLLYIGNEMATGQHNQNDMPVMLLGSAKGYIQPGRMIDYMNYSKPAHVFRQDTAAHKGSYPGQPFNRLMVTILQSMGLTPAEYQRGNQIGYGEYVSSKPERNQLYADVIAQRGNILPKIRG